MSRATVLSKSQKALVRKLFREGKTRQEIAAETQFTYNQVQYTLLKVGKNKYKRTTTKEVTNTSKSKEPYKEKYEKLSEQYKKAVLLLIENELLDIQI